MDFGFDSLGRGNSGPFGRSGGDAQTEMEQLTEALISSAKKVSAVKSSTLTEVYFTAYEAFRNRFEDATSEQAHEFARLIFERS